VWPLSSVSPSSAQALSQQDTITPHQVLWSVGSYPSLSEGKGILMRRCALIVVAILAAATPAVVAHVAQAGVPIQLCTVNGSHSLCLNRAGGGTGNGAAVIGWSADGDSNNDFEYSFLSSACGSGRVTIYAGGGCPFAVGSGLNAEYDGAYIVSLYAYNQNKCVGSSGMGNAVLTSCPDRWGNGPTGTVDIIVDNYNAPTPIINLYWSNYFGNNFFVCGPPPRGQEINLSNILLTLTPPQCNWNEI
jgi:hypothetical protein